MSNVKVAFGTVGTFTITNAGLANSPTAGWKSNAKDNTSGLYLDALRMRWYRYIVSWSLKDQVDLAAAIRQTARSWRPEWPALTGWKGPGTPALVGLTVVVAAVVAWRWRRGGVIGRPRFERKR